MFVIKFFSSSIKLLVFMMDDKKQESIKNKIKDIAKVEIINTLSSLYIPRIILII